MITFYLSYIFYKFLAPFESKDHRLSLLWHEISFPYHIVTGFKRLNSYSTKLVKLHNRFGKFYITDNNINWIIASPAYERPDLDKLVNMMAEFLNENPQNKLVFIDIGASFGKFTIAIGNHFKKYGERVKIVAFEPDPVIFKLLKKNIELNKLQNVKIYDIAVSSQKTKKKFYYYPNMQMVVSFPTSQQVDINTDTLDNLFKQQIDSNLGFFIKLDVEGHEAEVLEGGGNFLSRASKVVLLMEDSSRAQFKNKKYLLKKLQLLCKITPQNSFWSIK